MQEALSHGYDKFTSRGESVGDELDGNDYRLDLEIESESDPNASERCLFRKCIVRDLGIKAEKRFHCENLDRGWAEHCKASRVAFSPFYFKALHAPSSHAGLRHIWSIFTCRVVGENLSIFIQK